MRSQGMIYKRLRMTVLLAVIALTGFWMGIGAQDKKAETPPAAPVPAAAPAPAATPPAPPEPIPDYFSGTTSDPKKPSAWPDPTGGSAGTWATPAGDRK